MKLKKVLSALLVVAMIMSVFTVMAFANETLAFTPIEEGVTYTLNYVGADSKDVIANQKVYMVSDGFYQNAANFDSSTTFYITGYKGLLYFRELVNNEDGVADAYVESFTTAGSTANFYQTNIFTGKTVHLLADIHLEGENWNKAIGYVHNTPMYDKMLFYGTFDGHNHTVYNLSISSDSDNKKNEYGFFGTLGAKAGQTIKNLTLKNVSISGGSYVGGFAGNAQSNVINFENCHLNGLININGNFAGGLCGIGSANFVDCAVNADDESIIEGTSFAGGIIASERCSAGSSLNVSGNSVSNISIRSMQYAGGIIGGMASGAKGNISITDNQASDLIITTYSSYQKDPGAIIGGNSEGYTTVSLSGNTVSDTTVSKQCGWSTVSIEDSEYETLEKAIEVATDGDVITLLQDINITAEEFTGTDYYTVEGKDITIDLNGFDIIAEADTNSAHNLFFVKNGAALSIKDTSEAADGVISYEFKGENNGWKQQATIYSNGNVSIYSGTVQNITDEDATSGMSFTIDEHPNQWGDTYTNLNPTFHMYGGYVYTLMGEAVRIANYGTNNPDIVTHGIVDGGKIEGWDALFIQYANTTARQLDVKINGGELIGENAGVRFYSPAITAVDGNTAKPLTVEYNGGKIKTLNPNARPTEYNGAMIIQNTSNIEAPEAITAYADISVKDGYYVAALADNWYELKQGDANIINKDAVLGTTIELDHLARQDNIDVEEDATYKVVVNVPSASDKEKAEAAIDENLNDQNINKVIYDVKVEKTDSNGTKTYVDGIEYQPVTITLSENIKPGSDVFVYHVEAGGAVVQMTVAGNQLSYSGNTITFIAPSFSTYAVTYTADDVEDTNITMDIGVAFEEVAQGEYDIVLKSLKEDKIINRFMSATIAFEKTGDTIAYEVEPVAYVSVEEVEDDVFRFNMDGINHPYVTGESVNIGKVYFTGYGSLQFKVDNTKTRDNASEGIAINIVSTAEATDNIVRYYTPVGDATATPKLTLNDDVDTISGGESTGVIDATLAKNTKNLTINVKFNNIISDNKAAYQDMKVTVSGGDLTSPLEYKLGNGTKEIALNGDTYTVEIADTLTKNVGYTVKVEGAGYRTARYNVNMTQNKTLNFWNNVKDNAEEIEADKAASAVTKNFLAGDIVKDNNINIYDLSAVVSYFGTENLVSAHSAYAKYDLNRDGVIDSKDVAYVLVSWGE